MHKIRLFNLNREMEITSQLGLSLCEQALQDTDELTWVLMSQKLLGLINIRARNELELGSTKSVGHERTRNLPVASFTGTEPASFCDSCHPIFYWLVCLYLHQL